MDFRYYNGTNSSTTGRITKEYWVNFFSPFLSYVGKRGWDLKVDVIGGVQYPLFSS